MDGQEIRVLLAEDDEDDYLLTRDLLFSIPRIVVHLDWAPTFDAAMLAIDNDHHDLYLFDYRLGAGDGLALLQSTVARGRKAPVIFLTGFDDLEIDHQAMNAGAADYLVKGQFDSRQLERSIRHALERTRAQERRQEVPVEVEIQRVREQMEHAEVLAQTDPLTGLGNRRRGEHVIQGAIAGGRPCSLLVFDLNGFKPINDRYGHNQGDEVLQRVASALSRSVRETDVVCRWGGDEFVILLHNTALAEAEVRAAQIQVRTFGDYVLKSKVTVRTDATVGVAEYRPGETAAEFFERADQLLLAHKRERYSGEVSTYAPGDAEQRPEMTH